MSAGGRRRGFFWGIFETNERWRRRRGFFWGGFLRLTDAASAKASPSQTGQRSGKLIAKGGVSPIEYLEVVLCTLRRAFACSLPKRWISPTLKPPLNCLLKGTPCPNLLSLATKNYITSLLIINLGGVACNGNSII